MKELESRIRNIQAKQYGSDKNSSPLKPIERVLYGLKLIGMPGHSLLKMAQLTTTSVYKNYLYADISEHSRIYVELVDEVVPAKESHRKTSHDGNKDETNEEESVEAEEVEHEKTAEKKVFIFMVCDSDAKNYSDMVDLI